MTGTVERRTMLGGIVAAIAAPLPALAATDPFMNLSATLLGTTDLDPALGRAYQTALRVAPQAVAIDELTTLARIASGAALLRKIKDTGLEAAANAVVAAWYSGTVDGDVITYTGARAWDALPFTKPNGTCGGTFGYWSDPPA